MLRLHSLEGNCQVMENNTQIKNVIQCCVKHAALKNWLVSQLFSKLVS